MKGLTFVTAPAQTKTRRLGTLATGIIEMPELGGLTVDEADTIQELLAMEQSSFVKGAQIADAIAKQEKISISEAFNIIESAISGRQLEQAADEIRCRHAARIEEVARVYTAAGTRNMRATVTALIRHRQNLPDWSMADTGTLPKALRDAIWQLAQDEQAAEDMPSTPPTEDDLGKPQPDTIASPKRTGAKSSGNS